MKPGSPDEANSRDILKSAGIDPNFILTGLKEARKLNDCMGCSGCSKRLILGSRDLKGQIKYPRCDEFQGSFIDA